MGRLAQAGSHSPQQPFLPKQKWPGGIWAQCSLKTPASLPGREAARGVCITAQLAQAPGPAGCVAPARPPSIPTGRPRNPSEQSPGCEGPAGRVCPGIALQWACSVSHGGSREHGVLHLPTKQEEEWGWGMQRLCLRHLSHSSADPQGGGGEGSLLPAEPRGSRLLKPREGRAHPAGHQHPLILITPESVWTEGQGLLATALWVEGEALTSGDFGPGHQRRRVSRTTSSPWQCHWAAPSSGRSKPTHSVPSSLSRLILVLGSCPGSWTHWPSALE